jgi:hypothetical protein
LYERDIAAFVERVKNNGSDRIPLA